VRVFDKEDRVVVSSVTPDAGDLRFTPESARELAKDLNTAADKAEAYEAFDNTPGALYFDQDGSFYVVGTQHEGYRQPKIWKLRADGRRGASHANRDYWEREHGVKFTRVHIGGAPHRGLGGGGEL